MSRVFIGLDVGTQGTKGIAYHEGNQRVIARASASHGLLENEENIPGRAEQDPSVWVDAVKIVLSELGKVLKEDDLEISGIGVSGQQHGMVALDEYNNVIRPAKLWCDVEAAKEASEISGISDSFNIPAGFTAPKVLWMKRNEPCNWNKVRTIVLPHDYINMVLQCDDYYQNHDINKPIYLCNVSPKTDPGDASGTGYWDPKTRQYDRKLLEYIGLSNHDAVPTVLEFPNSICGYLSNYWKHSILNISGEKQIPISAGSGDNMCSALGCGCVSPGTAILSLGTSATLFGKSLEPLQIKDSMVAPFADATGHYLPLVCTMNCTGVLQSILQSWFPPGTTHQAASQLILDENVPAGCYGLLYLPFLNGERTPNWPHSTGALLGITTQNVKYSSRPAVIYRAAMEGIAYGIADAMNELKRVSASFDPQFLSVVGGGSKNVLWGQILADILQKNIFFSVESESAALGAAFQVGAAVTKTDLSLYIQKQMLTIGYSADHTESVQPIENTTIKDVYRKGFANYLDITRRMFGSTI